MFHTESDLVHDANVFTILTTFTTCGKNLTLFHVNGLSSLENVNYSVISIFATANKGFLEKY